MNALKCMREAAGMSQSQLAKASNVSVRMIQYYEQGIKDINKANVLTCLRLAEALDCDVYEILNDRTDYISNDIEVDDSHEWHIDLSGKN